MGLLEINWREIIAKLFYGIYLWDTPDRASKEAKLSQPKKAIFKQVLDDRIQLVEETYKLVNERLHLAASAMISGVEN